jgi:S-adenosylmethionine decarboxylase
MNDLVPSPGVQGAPATRDFFVNEDGLRFAGIHLLIEFWGGKNLNRASLIESTLRLSAKAAGANILSIHTHNFSPRGVTGIAVLEESHISIHTWPEHDFAAVDIFMCGNCDPHAAIGPLKTALEPEKIVLSEHRRGILV